MNLNMDNFLKATNLSDRYKMRLITAKLSRADVLEICILLTVLMVYFFSAKGYIEVLDTEYSVQTAISLIEGCDLTIDPDVLPNLTEGSNGMYSKYGIGIPLYYLPYVLLARGLSFTMELSYREPLEFLISIANIPISLVTLHFFYQLLLQFGISRKISLLAMIHLALGTLFWRYTVYDFSEAQQACYLLLSVFYLMPFKTRSWFKSGLFFGFLLLVKQVYIIYLPLFALYIWSTDRDVRNEDIRRLSGFLIPCGLCIAGILLLNVSRFDNILETGYGSEATRFNLAQIQYTLPALLFSLDKGLFIFCPGLLVSLPGLVIFFKRYRREASLLSILIAFSIVISATWHSWMGGWSWGPRLLVPVVPLLAIPFAFSVQVLFSRGARPFTWFLLSLLILNQIPGILVKDQQISHIRENCLNAEEQKQADSFYVISWRLLYHKLRLTSPKEQYKVSDFGAVGNRVIDLNEYESFLGLNIWTEHLARHTEISALRFIPFLGMGLTLILLTGVRNRGQGKNAFRSDSSP